MRAPFLLALALLLVGAPAHAQRLSGAVVPEHYSLWFAPDLDEETFRGRATISVRLSEASRTITLHAAEIAFGDVTITAGGRTQSARVTLDPATETATFTVADPIPAGPASLEIAYTGLLNDKLRGFYISQANGRKYAVTQMEPTDARRAFPSFDEPAYKATFDVSMTIDEGDTAISNGRRISDTPGPEPGTRTVRFAPTPKMSTYLVAMLVGDFVCREGSADGTPIRVCSTPDKRELTAFALEAAEQQLRFYNDYFGIRYPFGKMDIIAVPDFAAGAMENAGAITFRERLLLVDPERASVDVMRTVASVISHEIAHQWFGNLVTMKWWDDIWLNEGFATWIASKPIVVWRPEWNMSLDDAADTRTALGVDALPSTRPIRTTVETPEEINGVFDAIAYQKTAAVLRMVEAFVGPDAFRKGIASYLTKFSYGNATGEDFWTEMARVTGRPVDRIVRSYVDQPGVPVLSIRTSCTAGTGAVTVTQRRFVGTAGSAEASAAPQRWTLPVCFAPGGQTRCEVLDRAEQTFGVERCGPVFANASARGYYFTEYTPDAVRALGGNASSLEPVERLSLLGDEWWMVRSGTHDIGTFLDIAAAMSKDETAAVTDLIAGRATYAAEYVADPASLPALQAWLRAGFGPALSSLGLPGAQDGAAEQDSRRATLLRLLGVTADDPDVQRRAIDLAGRYLADAGSIPPTLAPAVLQVAAAAGDTALYERYLAKMETLADQPEEYYRFFGALSWFDDPALVQRTLELAVSPAVRSQDVGTLIGGLMAQPWGRDAAWRFTKARWRTLTQKLGTFQGIPDLVAAAGNLCSTDAAADVRAFFAANPMPSSARLLQQSIERIEACAAVDARQSRPLTEWLAARQEP